MKAKLLILTDWYLPGYKAGGPITSIYNLVANLAPEYDITIITSDRDFGDQNAYTNVNIGEWIFEPWGKIFYIPKTKNQFLLMNSLIRAEKYDFIYLNSMWSIMFTILPLLALRNLRYGKIILAPRGMLQDGAMNFKPLKKKMFINFLRLFNLLKSVVFHATDYQEEKDILKHFSKNKVKTLSNIPSPIADTIRTISKEKGSVKFIFISRVSNKKNLDGLLKYLLKTNDNIAIELSIYGQIESAHYWKSCLKIISKLPSTIKVNYNNAIDKKEVTKAIEDNHFFVLPTLGENFGHAIFESFACGRPVLISDQTPWIGLEEKNCGFDISNGNHEQWKRVIENCANMGQEEFNFLCDGAYRMAKTFFKDNNFLDQYKELFKIENR